MGIEVGMLGDEGGRATLADDGGSPPQGSTHAHGGDAR